MKREKYIIYYIVLFLPSCNDITNKHNNAADCYVSNGIYYEYADCNDSLNINKYHGRKVKPITPQIAAIIEETGKTPITRIIPNLNTRFFTDDGDPLLWWYKRKDEKYEIFSLPGKHPQYNKKLEKMTPDLAEKIINALEHNKLDIFVSNAVLPEDECYASDGIGYVRTDCEYTVHPKYKTPVKRLTSDIAYIIENIGTLSSSDVRIIPDINTRFFTNNGDPVIWYFEHEDGKLEFFRLPGKHPQLNEKLLPIKRKIVDILLKYMADKRDTMITGMNNDSSLENINTNVYTVVAIEIDSPTEHEITGDNTIDYCFINNTSYVAKIYLEKSGKTVGNTVIKPGGNNKDCIYLPVFSYTYKIYLSTEYGQPASGVYGGGPNKQGSIKIEQGKPKPVEIW